MGRHKSRLNEIIDQEITSMMEANGRATARDVYQFLVSSHDDVIQAEMQRFVEVGVMRHIESRLKSLGSTSDTTPTQGTLPGIADSLMKRMGRVMAVDRPDGQSEYIDILDRRTSVGEVRRFVASLEKQRSALKDRIDAFLEVLERCGLVTDDKSFHVALEENATKRAASPSLSPA